MYGEVEENLELRVIFFEYVIFLSFLWFKVMFMCSKRVMKSNNDIVVGVCNW